MSEKKEGRDIRDYLDDNLEMIRDIDNFTKDVVFEDFVSDKKTLYAVIRCLEVIGEAVKNIPESFRDKNPKIPWQEIAGMKNKLIHEYFGIDTETIWDTIKEDLSPMKETIAKIIRE